MKKRRRTRRVWMGSVAIDSGQLIIVDPGYLDQWERRRTFGYERVMAITNRRPHYGELRVVGRKAPECTAVAFASPNGDGTFPVFAEYEDGELVGVSVRF